MVDIDLHTHSQYSSDGEFEVTELVRLCLARKLTIFSVTDHNSERDVAEVVALSRQAGLSFVPIEYMRYDSAFEAYLNNCLCC